MDSIFAIIKLKKRGIRNHFIFGKQQLYKKQRQANTYNGVLLGFEEIHPYDVKFSKKFIENYLQTKGTIKMKTVLDCGAGIGRVSKQVLSPYFDQIDLVQQCQHFIQSAKSLLINLNVKNYYCKSIQQFNFEHKYDCIWLQWILTHLKYEDIVTFLTLAKQNIEQQGIIIVKENLSLTKAVIDYEDSTIIRTDKEWKQIFEKCGLKIIQQQIQKPWPQQLQQVKMYALI